MKECNQNIVDVLGLVKEMIILSDKGGAASEDDSCIMMYGVVRDCAYKIKKLAEEEKGRHVAADGWD